MLQANPDALGVRELLQKTTLLASPDIREATTVLNRRREPQPAPSPAENPVVSAPTQVWPQAPSAQAVPPHAAPPEATLPQATLPMSVPRPRETSASPAASPRGPDAVGVPRRRAGTRAVIAAGALVVSGIVAAVIAQQMRTTSSNGVLDPGARSVVNKPVVVVPNGAENVKTATTPVGRSQESRGGSGVDPGGAAGKVSPPGQSPGSLAPGPRAGGSSGSVAAQADADRRGVFLDASGIDDSLRSELKRALIDRHVAIVESIRGARIEVSAKIEIKLRPAPFEGTSQLTADYVASLQMHNLATGARESLSFPQPWDPEGSRGSPRTPSVRTDCGHRGRDSD